MDFKEFIKEGEVKISGNTDVITKLKELKIANDDWLKAAELNHKDNSKFIITKAIKNVNTQLKKVAEAIDNAIKMEKKYTGK